MVGLSIDTVAVRLEEKSLVGHLVEGHGKVELDDVHLSSFIKLHHHQISHSQDELCLAGSLLEEAVLGVNQDVFEVRRYCYMDWVSSSVTRHHAAKCMKCCPDRSSVYEVLP